MADFEIVFRTPMGVDLDACSDDLDVLTERDVIILLSLAGWAQQRLNGRRWSFLPSPPNVPPGF